MDGFQARACELETIFGFFDGLDGGSWFGVGGGVGVDWRVRNRVADFSSATSFFLLSLSMDVFGHGLDFDLAPTRVRIIWIEMLNREASGAGSLSLEGSEDGRARTRVEEPGSTPGEEYLVGLCRVEPLFLAPSYFDLVEWLACLSPDDERVGVWN